MCAVCSDVIVALSSSDVTHLGNDAISGDNYDLENIKLAVQTCMYRVDNKHVAWFQQQVITELTQENTMQCKSITHVIYMVKE